MKKKNVKLEWYVLEIDFNTNKLIKYNVLYQSLVDDIYKNVKNKKIKNRTELKDYLKSQFMYHYWSKCEHEILVSSLFDKDNENVYKIDAWFQIEMNLDRIVDYIINEIKIEFCK